MFDLGDCPRPSSYAVGLDSGNKPSEAAEPERFYHGFVLGLLVDLNNRYAITSNRESGFGRYDIMLEPKVPGAEEGAAVQDPQAGPHQKKYRSEKTHPTHKAQ